jgi:hypothetical protein
VIEVASGEDNADGDPLLGDPVAVECGCGDVDDVDVAGGVTPVPADPPLEVVEHAAAAARSVARTRTYRRVT